MSKRHKLRLPEIRCTERREWDSEKSYGTYRKLRQRQGRYPAGHTEGVIKEVGEETGMKRETEARKDKISRRAYPFVLKMSNRAKRMRMEFCASARKKTLETGKSKAGK